MGNLTGTVLNLNLSGDIMFTYKSGVFSGGSLANECNGTIRNCSFTGSMIVACREMGTVSLGGLVGVYGTGAGEISDCRVQARLEARGKDCHAEMGGIVFRSHGRTIRNCSLRGSSVAAAWNDRDRKSVV